MQEKTKQLENWLADKYKKAPVLSKGGREFLVEIAPWLSLLAGIGTLITAYNLWHWVHRVDGLEMILGVSYTRWSLGIGLALLVSAVTGVMYLAAFSQLKDRKKPGWNLLFYAILLNVAYGIVLLFTDYGGADYLISSLIGAAIGFYFLFQIRSYYKVAPVKQRALSDKSDNSNQA